MKRNRLGKSTAPDDAQVAAAVNEPFRSPNNYLQESERIDQLKGESGVAGWNDFGWISNGARQRCRDAAGISVPRRQFVLKMIGLYLLVVVPVNWIVFRLLGRVEWAWVAVPVVALVWGVLVVWLAQLDIGFARAQTEVAVLEIQPDYQRGHLTRYTALYTSLSSSYDLELSDPTAVALPFSTERELLSDQSTSDVSLSSEGRHHLSGYPVASNSTGMVHSEQMFDLGGGLGWSAPEGSLPTVENRTKYRMFGAAVLRRRVDERGNVVDESAWVGVLEPGENVELHFTAHKPEVIAGRREQSELTARTPHAGALSLHRLIECAEEMKALSPGDVRLVAYYDAALAGLEVRPAAPQSRGATLVVAHLRYGPRQRPSPTRICESARIQHKTCSR